ncbi:MAG: D123-domain-containing protein [Monoraphidium minutum]|nr:MAG: D123-domain-containing protein [Monoraphidium minutum]
MCLEDSPQTHIDPTPMSASALAQCQFGAWYERLKDLAPESAVIPLSDAFVAFLAEDGVVLADDSDAMPRRAPPPRPGTIVDEDDYRPEFSESEDASDGGDDDPASLPWARRFPEVAAAINAAIADLGGAVAPKLNWSSPTDALWVAPGNSLRCGSAEQVVLLLKSSPRAAFDLELCARLAAGAARADAGPALALRRWTDMRPEREFRCFVHGHRPVGVCQRDPSQFYPQLAGEGARAALRDAVCDFQAALVGRRFTRGSYALDVYVEPSGAVRLVDVNPIADTTQPLLFDWPELPYARPAPADAAPPAASDDGSDAGSEGGGDESPPPSGPGRWDDVPLLLVEDEAGVQPGGRAAYGMPLDMLSLQEGFDDIIRSMRQQQAAPGGDA